MAPQIRAGATAQGLRIRVSFLGTSEHMNSLPAQQVSEVVLMWPAGREPCPASFPLATSCLIRGMHLIQEDGGTAAGLSHQICLQTEGIEAVDLVAHILRAELQRMVLGSPSPIKAH